MMKKQNEKRKKRKRAKYENQQFEEFCSLHQDFEIKKVEKLIRKFHKYIQNGKVKKLRKVVDIFSVNKWCEILMVETNKKERESGMTYLHQYCLKGDYDMVSVLINLLKADTDILDHNDNNFLHCALNYFLKSYDLVFLEYIVEEVVPGVKAFLLENRNCYGETPVDLLDEIISCLQDKHRFQFVEKEREIDSDFESETKWTQKLFFEMGEEDLSLHNEVFSQEELEDTYRKTKSESFTEWGDRIWKEYNRKKKISHLRSESKKRKHETQSDQNFSKKEYTEEREYTACDGMKPTDKLKLFKKDFHLLEKREKYEESCFRIFKESHLNNETLGINDLPWTHFPNFKFGDIDEKTLIEGMIEIMSHGFTLEEKFKYFKIQRTRWHPDKFLQKCGHKLIDNEKKKILDLVNKISQAINSNIANIKLTIID